MLTKTAIYKKYASLEDYQEFCRRTIEELKPKFPNLSLRPFAEFKQFLDNLVPKLVHKYLIFSGTMKNCSGVSPDFAEIASQAGYPTLVQFSPGHQSNVVLTSDGPYSVDLSYVQFTCKWDLTDPDQRDEAIENYKAIRRDPFSAIKVEKLPEQYFVDTRNPRTDDYDDLLHPDPMKSIQRYNPEQTEEIFPEMFDRFK